jgi:heterodisulfide reductase subunit A-like polyferredoxin
MIRKGAASKPRKSRTRSVKARSSDAPERLSSLSIWSATAPASSAPALNQNVRADVCVVGAGIAGLTTAYLLAREGKSVVVVEKNKVGQGETSHTSAHLSNEIDASYRKIESLHGEKGAHLTAQSHSSAITRIESIVATEHIDCGFERVDGYLFLGLKDSEKDLHD